MGDEDLSIWAIEGLSKEDDSQARPILLQVARDKSRADVVRARASRQLEDRGMTFGDMVEEGVEPRVLSFAEIYPESIRRQLPPKVDLCAETSGSGERP